MKNVKYLILLVLSFMTTQSYAQGYKIILTNGKTVTVRADETEIITFTTDKNLKTNIGTGTEETVLVSDVSLSHTSLDLLIGNTQKLVATVTPADATNPEIQWQSSNNSVASVSSEGVVSALRVGSATITAKSVDGSNKSATCKVTVSERTDNAPSEAKAVDLGLSVKWANMNVGATEVAGSKKNSNTGKLDCYGDYFAWGETEGKKTYSSDTYKYYKSTSTTTTDADGFQETTTVKGYTKYVPKSAPSSGYDGFYDDKTELEKADDAAYANWGGSWRMPTQEELDELLTKCTWTWSTLNGVNGYKVTGSNGNYIFLPAAGYRFVSSLYQVDSRGGFYWSSSLNRFSPWHVYFTSSNVDWCGYGRYCGFSVRPVCP